MCKLLSKTISMTILTHSFVVFGRRTYMCYTAAAMQVKTTVFKAPYIHLTPTFHYYREKHFCTIGSQ